jgi:hypothetical protein
MKNRLFVDLYSYRQRENKNPLEDWLTECLAATMRALPDTQLAALLAALLAPDAGQDKGPNSAKLQDAILAHIRVRQVAITTQHHAHEAGRPDMVITMEGRPWIVFENKVAAAISQRASETGPASHQLRDYARWLAQYPHKDLPGALIFVTHLTEPPADFAASHPADNYFGLTRTAVSWGEIARKIAALCADLPADHYAQHLAIAFRDYLKEKNMSSEFPDATAFAAAQIYLSQAALLENLVERMWLHASRVASFGKTNNRTLGPSPDNGMISAWRYAVHGPERPRKAYYSYVQTGFWFPGLAPWGGDSEAKLEARGVQAFLCFGNDEPGYFSDFPDAPDGFIRPSSNFVAMRALSSFPEDPQDRGQQIEVWISERADTLRAFLLDLGLVR